MFYTNATQATLRSNFIRSRTGKPLVLLPNESISLGETDWPLNPVQQRELDRYVKNGELTTGSPSIVSVDPTSQSIALVIQPSKLPRWEPSIQDVAFLEPEEDG